MKKADKISCSQRQKTEYCVYNDKNEYTAKKKGIKKSKSENLETKQY